MMNEEPVQGARVLVAVCGGVAAYKVVEVVSRLRQAGHDVRVAMTAAATQFVAPLTFAAVSGRPVLHRMFPENAAGRDLYPHLYPATEADVFVLAPATANMIGKIARGLGDDLVSTNALSLPPACRRIFCPAMNVEMWNQDIVQENVRRLEDRSWQCVGPEAGRLACGVEGEGRMAEPADIVRAVLEALGGRDLAERRVLVLSGPTREHLDPVRFLSNASSGRMGRALAEEAARRGAEVDFVTGPVAAEHLPRGPAIRVRAVTSAEEMLAAAREFHGAADVVAYAAAVADYAPAERAAEKRPKAAGETVLKLRGTPDVAATLNAGRRRGQVFVGFALQTGDGRAEAARKLQAKGFDFVVLNGPEALGAGEADYTLVRAGGAEPQFELWGRLEKRACARRIFDEVGAKLKS